MNVDLISGVVPLLGRALLHFVWQGALIGLFAELALLALRDARPQLRYAVACSALLACVLAPAVTLAVIFTSDPPGTADISTFAW